MSWDLPKIKDSKIYRKSHQAWPATEIGLVHFNERSSQCYDKRLRSFRTAQLGVVTLSQMMKGAECDIAAMTVGNDELSSVRMFSMFGR